MRVIKVLQLNYSNGQLSAQAVGRIDIPPQMRREKERLALIETRLKGMLKKERFKGRRILITVPNEAIRYKSFRLPQMPGEELEQVARFEAEERFAFEEADAEFRFLHAGEIRQGQEMRHEVIAMGCPGEALRSMLELTNRLGLVCEAVEPSPYCLARRFTYMHQEPRESDAAQVLVDLGYLSTRVVIMRGQEIIFIKSIAVGGLRFEELTAKTLNVSCVDAAELRNAILAQYACPGRLDCQQIDKDICASVHEASRPAIEQLGKEIGLCLRYYSVTFRGIRPDVLTCVGGESYDAHLLADVTEITGMNTQIGQPFARIDTDQVLSAADSSSGSPEWATVTGLALRELELMYEKKVAS